MTALAKVEKSLIWINVEGMQNVRRGFPRMSVAGRIGEE